MSTLDNLISALKHLGGSLFFIIGATLFGYFYFLFGTKLSPTDYVLQLATSMTLTIVTGILLVQILVFSPKELKEIIPSKKWRTIIGVIVIILIAFFFIQLLKKLVSLLAQQVT